MTPQLRTPLSSARRRANAELARAPLCRLPRTQTNFVIVSVCGALHWFWSSSIFSFCRVLQRLRRSGQQWQLLGFSACGSGSPLAARLVTRGLVRRSCSKRAYLCSRFTFLLPYVCPFLLHAQTASPSSKGAKKQCHFASLPTTTIEDSCEVFFRYTVCQRPTLSLWLSSSVTTVLVDAPFRRQRSVA